MRERTKPERSARSRQTEVGGDVVGSCVAPGVRDLLLPYAFGGCVDEQEDVFEAHLLDCDRCYQDLAAIERTRSLIERFILAEPPILARSRSQRRRRRTLLVLGGALLLAAAAAAGYLLGVSA